MDYTQSNAFATHAGTGNRMHNASQATPTAVSDADLNGPVWELVSLIKQAGITPAGFDANTPATYQQVAAAIAALQRQQTNTAYTTAGTAPAFTVTLPGSAIALAALGVNLRLRLKFHAAGAGSDTLNIAGLGAKSLKQYDSTGAKVAGVIAAGQLVDVEYDGTDFVLLDPLPGALGRLAGMVYYANQTVTLSTADVGKCVISGGTSNTVTMPLISSVTAGASFSFYSQGGVLTINRQGATDQLWVGNAFKTSIAISGCDYCTFVSDGVSWHMISGTSLQGIGGVFASSKSTNGYQKLPGGLILQWGSQSAPGGGSSTTATYPIAFPNGTLAAMVTRLSGSATSGAPMIASWSATQLVWDSARGSSNEPCNYLAIGW
jgi:hypothetical protein